MSLIWDNIDDLTIANSGYLTCGPRQHELYEIDVSDIDDAENSDINESDAPKVGNLLELPTDYVSISKIEDEYLVEVTYGTNEPSDAGSHYIQIRSDLEEYTEIGSKISVLIVTFYEL